MRAATETGYITGNERTRVTTNTNSALAAHRPTDTEGRRQKRTLKECVLGYQS